MSDVATRSPVDALVLQVRSPEFREQIASVLPENVSVDRFARVTTTALRENPEVAQDPTTLLASVIRCAQDGLLPDGHEAALVVFKTKHGPRVQYLPMIGGYRKIAAEHGWSIRTHVVRENDPVFEYELGVEPSIKHRPALIGDPGDVIAAYAVATHRTSGEKLVEIMGLEEVEKVRATSRAATSGPWVDWFERMAEKTVGRRLFKKLPLSDSDRVARVVAVDEQPEEAVALMYGPRAGDTFRARELESGSEVHTAEPTQKPDRRPAASASNGAEDATPQSASAPAEFEGEEPQGSDDPIVAQAGAVKFNDHRYAGVAISDVAEAEPSYITWAYHSWKGEPVRSAIITYVDKAKPELKP